MATSTGSRRCFSAAASTASTSTATASTANDGTADTCDVLIVGGGATGCALAKHFNDKLPGLDVHLLEARDAPPAQESANSIPHPRSYALSPKSLQIIGDLPNVGHYDSMQVWQAKSPASLVFTSNDLLTVDGSDTSPEFLGACVEDKTLVSTLWQSIQGTTTCRTNATIESMQNGNATAASDPSPAPVAHATVELRSGERLSTKLLIGCDGANSYIRKAVGIGRKGIEYNLQALTFTVELERPLGRRAFQRYLDDGNPLALLPTFSDNHAVVVWSTTKDVVEQYKDNNNDNDDNDLNGAALVEQLNLQLQEGPQRVPPLFGDAEQAAPSILSNIIYGTERVLDTMHYGMALASQQPGPNAQYASSQATYTAPPKIKSIIGPKFAFPLSCFHADSYVNGRVALVGDAAHTVHPMAGQGLNLGIQDVEVLVDTVGKAHRAGMDISTFLPEYNANRRRNITLSLSGIHALQRIFGETSKNSVLQHGTTFGINSIQMIGPLRRQLAAAAAYGVSM